MSALLRALANVPVLLPVTTLTPEQYARVRLLDKPPAYAICANGGRLLVDGADDPERAAAVRARVADGRAPLDEIRAHLAATSGEFVLKRRVASDLFAYRRWRLIRSAC